MTLFDRYKAAFPYIAGAITAIPTAYLLFDFKPVGAVGFSVFVILLPWLKHYWDALSET